MSQKLENCWMILPGHRVGYGDIEIEGDAIAAINFVENGMSSEQRINRPTDQVRICHLYASL